MGFLDALKKIVSQPTEFTPSTFQGYDRSYHYTDVMVIVVWQFGGKYGKTCSSAGMWNGAELKLVPKKRREDPKTVYISWKNQMVGLMRGNRMRDMVHVWMAEELPVLARAYRVGGEDNLLLELAFYGKPKHHYDNKESKTSKK